MSDSIIISISNNLPPLQLSLFLESGIGPRVIEGFEETTPPTSSTNIDDYNVTKLIPVSHSDRKTSAIAS